MKILLLLSSLTFVPVLLAADCPTDHLPGFGGTFKGVLSPVSFQGAQAPLENVTEIRAVKNCTSFDFDIHYSNPETNAETREVKFSGVWDKSKKSFALKGPLLTGWLRIIHERQFLLYFDTQFAGQPAYCNEMINITSDASQTIRSVHCFAGGPEGTSLGVRSALTTRVR